MKHAFTITLSSNPDDVISKVKSLILESGGTFSGDSSSGSFSGNGVVGNYLISGTVATITIIKKPLLAPVKLVESKIREYFNQL